MSKQKKKSVLKQVVSDDKLPLANPELNLPVSTRPNSISAGRWNWVLCTALFLLAGLVFLPSLHNDFLNYDDNDYVTSNPHVTAGLNWAGIKWAFGSTEAGNWHPLTWISHMADCQIYGLNPEGHHATNILLHAINTALVFLVLRKLTGFTWRSLFLAAIFGVHPLRVESVAWISERKDVLSMLFGLLCLWSYSFFVKESERSIAQGRSFYVLSLLFFALSLLSKAMFVSLPLLLLLIDWWPLKRYQQTAALALWKEKALFLLVSLAICGVTFVAQKRGGAVQALADVSMAARLENSLVSYGRYLEKMLYPTNLSVFYPRQLNWSVGVVIGACILVLGMSLLAWWARRKMPWVFVGWFWYVISLVPVIGLVQVGQQAMADRYTLLPSIGVLLMGIWAVGEWLSRSRSVLITVSCIGITGLIGCIVLTEQQIRYWKNSETLFQHALSVTENNYIAYLQLGDFYSEQGRNDEALKMYERSIAIFPKLKQTHNNLGNALLKSGYTQEAVREFQTAIQLEYNFAPAHNGLGAALKSQDRLNEAAAEFRTAIKLDPGFGDAYSNLGYTLATAGALDEAILQFSKALELKPQVAEAHCDLGVALAAVGKKDQALEQFREALKLRPNFPDAEEQMRILTHPSK